VPCRLPKHCVSVALGLVPHRLSPLAAAAAASKCSEHASAERRRITLRGPEANLNASSNAAARRHPPRRGVDAAEHVARLVDPTMPSPAACDLIDQGTTTRPGTAAPPPSKFRKVRPGVYRDKPLAVLK
jgi:hypothetical protein